jgi:hypothetical protein
LKDAMPVRVQDDIELHAKADTMNTDLEIITLREDKQTALEVHLFFVNACPLCLDEQHAELKCPLAVRAHAFE